MLLRGLARTVLLLVAVLIASCGAQQWDEAGGWQYKGRALDSPRCSMRRLDVLEGVGAADRARWRRFLLAREGGSAVPGSWPERKRALVKRIRKTREPVVLAGLLGDAAELRREWSLAWLAARNESLRGDGTDLVALSDLRMGDAELMPTGTVGQEDMFTETYSSQASTSDQVRAGREGQPSADMLPTTLRQFLLSMHANRDEELRRSPARPAPQYVFTRAVPRTVAARLQPVEPFARLLGMEPYAQTSLLVGPAFSHTYPHQHGRALQLVLVGAKRWFVSICGGARGGAQATCVRARDSAEHGGFKHGFEALEAEAEAEGGGASGDADGSHTGGGANYQCVVRAGEAIVVPQGAYHSVVNAVDSVAITFEFSHEETRSSQEQIAEQRRLRREAANAAFERSAAMAENEQDEEGANGEYEFDEDDEL